MLCCPVLVLRIAATRAVRDQQQWCARDDRQSAVLPDSRLGRSQGSQLIRIIPQSYRASRRHCAFTEQGRLPAPAAERRQHLVRQVLQCGRLQQQLGRHERRALGNRRHGRTVVIVCLTAAGACSVTSLLQVFTTLQEYSTLFELYDDGDVFKTSNPRDLPKPSM